MISENDKNKISECAKKYNVSEIILFGSSLYIDNPNDIDLGVSGIAPERFFSFFAEVSEKISKNLDLFYMDAKDARRFTELIKKEGILLYGK